MLVWGFNFSHAIDPETKLPIPVDIHAYNEASVEICVENQRQTTLLPLGPFLQPAPICLFGFTKK